MTSSESAGLFFWARLFERELSLNPGLNRPNPGLNFKRRVSCVVQRKVKTNLGLNGGLNLTHRASRVKLLNSG